MVILYPFKQLCLKPKACFKLTNRKNYLFFYLKKGISVFVLLT